MENLSNIETSKKITYDLKSASGIARFVLRLLWVITKKLLKFTLRCIVRFCVKLYKATKEFYKWWTSGDTKAKRKILYRKCKTGLILLAKWIAIGCLLLWKGIITLGKAIAKGVFHLKDTSIFIAKKLKKWYKTLKETDYKAIIKEKKTQIKASVTNLVNENDDGSSQSEEELLKELEEKNKNKGKNSFEKTLNKITKYIE